MVNSPEFSRLARSSLILGILAWAIWPICIAAFSILDNMMPTPTENVWASETRGYVTIYIAFLISFLLSGTGVFIGILALRKSDPKRGEAIAGLVLSLIPLIPYLALIGLLVYSYATTPI